ncbi:MAG: hypothetical protein ABR867_05850, partial [Nitrososphaerales archaeon]
MRSKTTWFAVAIMPVVMLLLLSGNVAYAAVPGTVSLNPSAGGYATPRQTASLNLTGGVISPGVQTY